MASAQLSSLRRAGAGSDLKETALVASGARLPLLSRCLQASPEIWRTFQPPKTWIQAHMVLTASGH